MFTVNRNTWECGAIVGNMEYFIYLAAIYDSGVYSACAYQQDCITTTTTSSTVTSFGAPSTGFLYQSQIMIPLILGLAILIAGIFLMVKKAIRQVREE